MKNLYFIGIGGISMSALAKQSIGFGAKVYGYDLKKNPETAVLEEMGAIIQYNRDKLYKKCINVCDLVIYTDAIPNGDERLVYAKKAKKKIMSRAEYLATLCKKYAHVIGVAGSHGKTTCTAMCTHVLKAVGVPFSAHIGGEDRLFHNYFSGGFDYFVTEACEYKKNFLKLPIETAVVLNIDKDHMDCYDDETDLVASFSAFAKNAEWAVLNADDKKQIRTENCITFGIDNPADYQAVDVKSDRERYSFIAKENGEVLGEIRLKTFGRVYVYNALATLAVMRRYGFAFDSIKRGLENFTAVQRRFEKLGEYKGATVIADYAHHPREIASTVTTAKSVCDGTLYVVFQPHTYSRTKLLKAEFVSAFSSVERLIIYKTYPARETFDKDGSGKSLKKAIKKADYVKSLLGLKKRLKKVKKGDTVLILGAGDIYEKARKLTGYGRHFERQKFEGV